MKKIHYHGVDDTREYRYKVCKNWQTGKTSVYRKEIEPLERISNVSYNGWEFVCEL